MTKRLAEDHANAQMLARGLAEIPGVQIDPEKVQTNILVFDISGTGVGVNELSAKLKEQGVLANGINAKELRMVTHKDVSREDCETALSMVKKVLA
jgi:threonine aldolase